MEKVMMEDGQMWLQRWSWGVKLTTIPEVCIRSFSFLPLMQRYGCTTVSSTFISLQIELPLFFAFFAPPLPLPFSFFLSLVLFSLSYLTSLFICLDAVRSGMRRAERRERPDLICPISYYYYLFFLFVFWSYCCTTTIPSSFFSRFVLWWIFLYTSIDRDILTEVGGSTAICCSRPLCYGTSLSFFF